MRAVRAMVWVCVGICLSGARCDGDEGESGHHHLSRLTLSFWEVACYRAHIECDGLAVALIDGHDEYTSCSSAPDDGFWPVVVEAQVSFTWMGRYTECRICDGDLTGAACRKLSGGDETIHVDIGTPIPEADADAQALPDAAGAEG